MIARIPLSRVPVVLATILMGFSLVFAFEEKTAWLTKHGQIVKLVRFPEERRSAEHLKFLQMDLATPDALRAFSSFGAEDAVAAFRLCQTEASEEGKIITEVFCNMPEIKPNNLGGK